MSEYKLIFISGFMGSGKSNYGKSAARRLNLLFLDTDELIVLNAKKSIAEIFEQDGEAAFRAMETAVLEALCESAEKHAGNHTIVALGGGAILSEKNAALINANGESIFIDAGFDTCYARIKQDKNRPLAWEKSEAELRELFESRLETYRRNSKHVICGDGEVPDVANAVMGLIQELIKQE